MKRFNVMCRRRGTHEYTLRTVEAVNKSHAAEVAVLWCWKHMGWRQVESKPDWVIEMQRLDNAS